MPYGSPNEMGHSPAEMESAKQERKNLMQDMPIDNRAGSWMSKHSKSGIMMKGPMEMGHKESPAEKHCM